MISAQENGPLETQTTDPKVEDLIDAGFWIGALHRRTCRDLDAIVALQRRIAYLELPWHIRFSRKVKQWLM